MTIHIDGLEPMPNPSNRNHAWTTADGSTLGFADAPRVDGEYPQETHAAAALVQPVLKAFGALDKARRDARDNKGLNDVGRLGASEPARMAAAAALDKAEAGLADFDARIAKVEADVFARPALDPTDVVGGLQDVEIRDYLRKLPTGERGKALGDLAKQPRLLEAVVRSPVPMGAFSDLAERIWLERTATTHPRAPELARFRAASEWANSVLPLLAKRIRQKG